MSSPEPITAPNLTGEATRHGFFTRTGGVSEGIYKGLNVGLGSNDDRDKVVENRRRVAATLGLTPSALHSLYQVHSPDVVEIDQAWPHDYRPKADALVTARPDIAICVMSADCGPVLFLDPINRVVGAAHAGWKGATSGVLENTIVAMERLGARRDRISTTLGPTISAANYEVGPEFIDRLQALDPTNDRWLAPSTNTGHAMFDLPGYIVARLTGLGVDAAWTGQCTYADEERFFSYRRTTHRGEGDYGRQIAAITLVNE